MGLAHLVTVFDVVGLLLVALVLSDLYVANRSASKLCKVKRDVTHKIVQVGLSLSELAIMALQYQTRFTTEITLRLTARPYPPQCTNARRPFA